MATEQARVSIVTITLEGWDTGLELQEQAVEKIIVAVKEAGAEGLFFNADLDHDGESQELV